MIEELLTHDTELKEGDVALVFTTSGDLVIRHNITEVRETGVIDGAKNGAGFLMAIACAIMMGNELLAQAFISEAASKLEELEFAQVPRSMN